MVMEGFATMYLRMPMSASALPIHGKCSVEETKINLKFPFTNFGFELPSSPKEGANDFECKMTTPRGVMAMTISYIEALKCFNGSGRMEEEEEPVLTFCFFPEDSPMSKLPQHWNR